MSDDVKERNEGEEKDKFSLAKSAVERAILRAQSHKNEKPVEPKPKKEKQEIVNNEVLEEKPIISTPQDTPIEKPSEETKATSSDNAEPSTTNKPEENDESQVEENEVVEPKKPSKFEEQIKKFRENIALKIQKSKEIHKTLVHYNTINKPFVAVYYYVNNELIKSNKLELMDYELDGLVPSGYNRVASFIMENSDDYSNFELIVSSDKVFKTTNAYPKMNKFKLIQLYNQEINQSVPNYKDKYTTSLSIYNGVSGSIYYTYFIPIEILYFFNKIAKAIKSRCSGIELYSHFLFKSVSEVIKDDFVLHYANDVFSTVMLSYNGVFTTYYNALNDEKEIMTKYVSYISKHLLELEKKDTSNFYSNKKELVKFMGEDVKNIEIDFTKYRFNGVKL